MSDLIANFQSPLKLTEASPNANVEIDIDELSADAIESADFVIFSKSGVWKKITFTNFLSDLGAVTAESDPVFVASAAYSITAGLKNNWNTAYGWGDHSAAGYLTATTHDLAERHTLGDVVPHDDLADLNDVTWGTPSDNDVLAYDSTSGKAVMQSAGEAGLATDDHLQDAEHGGTGADLSAGAGYLYMNNGSASLVAAPSLPAGTTKLIPMMLHGDIVPTAAGNQAYMQAGPAPIPSGYTKITGLYVINCLGKSGSAGSSVIKASKSAWNGGGDAIQLSLAGTESAGSASGEIAAEGGTDSVYLFAVSPSNSYHTTLFCLVEVKV